MAKKVAFVFCFLGISFSLIPRAASSDFFRQMEEAKIASDQNFTWKQVGPGQGGTCRFIYIHPKDEKLLFMFNDMGSSYVTRDGGVSWQSLYDYDGNGEEMNQVYAMDFSCSNPPVGYAVSREGLMKTLDFGRTWTHIPSELDGNLVNALAVDPENESIVLAGGGQKISYFLAGITVGGGIWRSRDGGETFQPITQGLPRKPYVNRILIDPISPKERRTVFLCTNKGLFKSENTGDSWKKIEIPSAGENCVDMVASMDKEKKILVIYLLLETTIKRKNGKPVFLGGVFKSTDSGKSWADVTSNLYLNMNELRDAINKDFASSLKDRKMSFELPEKALQLFKDMVINHENPDEVYLTSFNKKKKSFPPGGVWKTEDGGTSWFLTTRYGEGWALNSEYRDYWKSRGQQMGENVVYNCVDERSLGPFSRMGTTAIAISKSNPSILMIAVNGAMLKSEDSGKTWFSVDSRQLPDGTWTGRGDSNIDARGVFIDPRKPEKVYLTCADRCLWLTENGGESCVRLWKTEIGNVSTLAFDPSDPQIMYLAKSRLWPGVFKSTDGGNTFRKLWKGVPRSEFNGHFFPMNFILVDPDSPVRSRRLYLACPFTLRRDYSKVQAWKGRGVLVSDNAGRTWHPFKQGLGDNLNVLCIAMDPGNPGILYAGTSALKRQNGIAPGGLFVSTDKAHNWKPLPLPEGINQVNHVHIDPRKPQTIYIASGNSIAAPAHNGIFCSEDGGNSWKQLFESRYCIFVTTSPFNREEIYLAKRAGISGERNPGVYFSRDGGCNWLKINKGLNTPEGILWITPDLKDKSKIWCANKAGGWFVGRWKE